MALPATHIKFALGLKEKFQASDMEKYISGTLYPDSRYLTKIDRKLTHNSELLGKNFLTNYFHKGWAVHYLCDEIQKRVTIKYFPEISTARQGDELWVKFSSIKNIEDVHDIKTFNIQPYLKHFHFVGNPNNEDIEKMEWYYDAIRKTYENKTETTINDYYNMWIGMGIEKPLVNQIIEKTKELMTDKKIIEQVSKFHDEMLENINSFLLL